MDIQTAERLARVETLQTATNATLEEIKGLLIAHIDKTDTRISRLERFGAWAAGAVTVITTGIVTYFKTFYRTH